MSDNDSLDRMLRGTSAGRSSDVAGNRAGQPAVANVAVPARTPPTAAAAPAQPKVAPAPSAPAKPAAHTKPTAVARPTPPPTASVHAHPAAQQVKRERPLVPDDLYDVVAWQNEGVLVSRDHLHDAKVLSFIARAEFALGTRLARLPSDMDSIRRAHETSPNRRADENDSLQIRVATAMFTAAATESASDVHITIRRSQAEVHFRIHGEYVLHKNLTVDEAMSLCSVIYNAMTDVSDRSFNVTTRQDGRISNPSFLPQNVYGIRIGKTPHVSGIDMTMRLLYNESLAGKTLADLGYDVEQQKLLAYLKKAGAMVIIAGPTNSGKSTTLRYILAQMYEERKGAVKIMTAEDPPEYMIPGAVQTPVIYTNGDDASLARAFGESIKAVLRADADILMVGELRDKASVEAALYAAVVGKPVWTTVHANSALAIPHRMVRDGMKPEDLLNDTLWSGFIFQTLLPTLCRHCRVPITNALASKRIDDKGYRYVARHIESAGYSMDNVHVRGPGCDACRQRAIAGRTVACEIVIPDVTLLRLIYENRMDEARRYWLSEKGGRTWQRQGVMKVVEGIVDPFDADAHLGSLGLDVALSDNKLTLDEVRNFV